LQNINFDIPDSENTAPVKIQKLDPFEDVSKYGIFGLFLLE
jgi:hypothetical protein